MIGIITSQYLDRSHHYKYSGYQKLISYLNIEKEVISPPKCKEIYWKIIRKPLKLCRIIPKSYYPIEFSYSDTVYEITHHFYGEDTFLLNGLIKKSKVVVTFHQPPQIFQDWMPLFWKKYIFKADKIIVVSRYQYKFFELHVGRERLVFIPHGVDVNNLKPNKSIKKEKFCLSTGGWLRDFETYLKAIKEILEIRKDIEFVIVMPKVHYKKYEALFTEFKNNPKLKILIGIPDELLSELYLRASLYVAPMQDCTANNGILEAMAFGLPILATNVGGATDYIEGVFYENGDFIDLKNKIIQLIDDEVLLNRFGSRNRELAETKFAWENIANKTKKIYESIL